MGIRWHSLKTVAMRGINPVSRLALFHRLNLVLRTTLIQIINSSNLTLRLILLQVSNHLKIRLGQWPLWILDLQLLAQIWVHKHRLRLLVHRQISNLQTSILTWMLTSRPQPQSNLQEPLPQIYRRRIIILVQAYNHFHQISNKNNLLPQGTIQLTQKLNNLQTISLITAVQLNRPTLMVALLITLLRLIQCLRFVHSSQRRQQVRVWVKLSSDQPPHRPPALPLF